MKILITGASGFLGEKLKQRVKQKGFSLICSYKPKSFTNKININKNQIFISNNIFKKTDWSKALKKVSCIIHCAGKAHIIDKKKNTSLKMFSDINEEGTINLANQAVKHGVKRFIFISSIGVNGAYSQPKKKFTNLDKPRPIDNYAISKFEAEKKLLKMAKKKNLEVVIIRPPIIYGENVKGNFLRLLKLIDKFYILPLPFLNIKNKRSIIGVDNLIDLIMICITHKRAKNKVFLASDQHDLFFTDLITKISILMKKKVFLFPFPFFILKFICNILGKRRDLDRLVQCLQIDYTDTKNILGWSSKKTSDEGLMKMVKSFKDNKSK